MKRNVRFSALSLLLTLSCTIFAQNPVVIVDYMKVKPGMTGEYLEVEQQWKKIHQKRIEAGLITGWQLWQNKFAADGDPYQYVTITWYENFAKTFENAPDDLLDGIFTDEEINDLFSRTLESRKNVHQQVSHRFLVADGDSPSKIIVLNHMKVNQDMQDDYLHLESEIWKPYHEEAIKRGYRTHWGVWANYPFEEGVANFVTVDGYDNPEQMNTGEDLLSVVHPDMTWEEVDKKTSAVRKLTATEIWVLVDAVFAE